MKEYPNLTRFIDKNIPVGSLIEMRVGGQSNTRYRRVNNYVNRDGGFFRCYCVVDKKVVLCSAGMAITHESFRIDFAPAPPQWTSKEEPIGVPIELMNNALSEYYIWRIPKYSHRASNLGP